MRRGSALALAILCLFGQVASLAHVVVVAHVTCAEHGEQVHATEEPGARVAGGWYDAEAEADPGHEDHCAAASLRAASLAFAEPAASPAAAPDRGAAAPEAQAPPARAALFRLAPKTSPPLVA